MRYRRPRGVNDLFPPEIDRWQAAEALFRDLCLRFRYQEIRTPLFEQTELFLRAVGEDTDVVSKEMYTFEDRGGRSLTLRPEGTAPVVRAYLDKGLKHDAYAALVGYATERELKTAVGNAATLRDAVDQVKARNREFKTRADQLAKDLVKAQNDTKSSKRTAEDIRRRLQTRINGLIKDMARLKQRHRNEVEGLRRKLTKANRAVHKADKKAE